MPDATAIANATQCKETTVHHIHKQRLCLLAKTKTSDTKQSMCFLDQIRICVCVTLLHAALISCPLLCHAMPGKTSLCWPLCLCAGLFLAFRPHPPSARPAPLMPHAQWTTRATPCCWCKPSSRAIFASRLSVYRDSQAQHSCTNSSCHTSSYGLVHFPFTTQNISSYTHHIKSFDACMEY
jgi:hypothetical protein